MESLQDNNNSTSNNIIGGGDDCDEDGPFPSYFLFHMFPLSETQKAWMDIVFSTVFGMLIPFYGWLAWLAIRARWLARKQRRQALAVPAAAGVLNRPPFNFKVLIKGVIRQTHRDWYEEPNPAAVAAAAAADGGANANDGAGPAVAQGDGAGPAAAQAQGDGVGAGPAAAQGDGDGAGPAAAQAQGDGDGVGVGAPPAATDEDRLNQLADRIFADLGLTLGLNDQSLNQSQQLASAMLNHLIIESHNRVRAINNNNVVNNALAAGAAATAAVADENNDNAHGNDGVDGEGPGAVNGGNAGPEQVLVVGGGPRLRSQTTTRPHLQQPPPPPQIEQTTRHDLLNPPRVRLERLPRN